ncbi:rCG27320 [Rattus norvegicus]|uniref:RCG27320 n=1 Tax=Rattus norvegicus TaxID=10116 RepID=A6HMN8_RAT|nr:rCG27320 [Rattus norvegicus]
MSAFLSPLHWHSRVLPLSMRYKIQLLSLKKILKHENITVHMTSQSPFETELFTNHVIHFYTVKRVLNVSVKKLYRTIIIHIKV